MLRKTQVLQMHGYLFKASSFNLSFKLTFKKIFFTLFAYKVAATIGLHILAWSNPFLVVEAHGEAGAPVKASCLVDLPWGTLNAPNAPIDGGLCRHGWCRWRGCRRHSTTPIWGNTYNDCRNLWQLITRFTPFFPVKVSRI